MYEHFSRRAARRHDLGLAFAGIAATLAAQASVGQRAPAAPPAELKPHAPASPRPFVAAPAPRSEAN
ncbi:hypothetical protein [Massilia sp. 9I]|uniref:hypothetical protein n=1 Tax=Massilia sp. 9I TaxID=2653152 RepID=UPI0012F0AA12|nr:hypothetical protein [Massilia sp. 9I]VXB58604.1 hypothetical protein MASSI9I_40055 [Massilia sp. 9I]